MRSHPVHEEGGWSLLVLLGLIVCAGAGGLFAHAILLCSTPGLTPIIPWAMLSVFFLPVGYAVTAYTDLSKLLEVKGLTSSEVRRLKTTIGIKQTQIMIAICFMLVTAGAIALGLLAASSNPLAYHPVIVAAGALLAVTLAIVPLLMLQIREVNNFKTRVTARSNRRKQLASKLEKLSPKGM